MVTRSDLEHNVQIKSSTKFLLYPESQFITFWDMLMTVTLLFTSIFRPYQVAFDRKAIYEPFWNVVNFIAEMLFFADVIIDFNTAFQSEDFKLIEDRKLIAKRYFMEQFIFDFTALIPIDYFFLPSPDTDELTIYMILRLYKMIRITRLFKVYSEVTDETQSSIFRNVLKIDPGMLRLSFFFLLFFLLCHFAACLWVIIGLVNQQLQDPNDVTPDG